MRPTSGVTKGAAMSRATHGLNRLSALAALLVCLVLPAQTGWCGTIYKYVDEDGVTHYSNIPSRPEYRSVRLKPLLVVKRSSRPADPKAYDRFILSASRRYGVDSKLVRAVIRAESGFNPRAVSPKGAMGLMQIMPRTSRHLGIDNPFDPRQNIFGGVRYLKELMGRFNNNLILALAAYNAGPQVVEKHKGIPPYAETKTYLKRVINYYVQYR